MTNKIDLHFKNESQNLIYQMRGILQSCQGTIEQAKDIALFAQIADRIMGAAKSIEAIHGDPHGYLSSVAGYTELCKAIGYKLAQLKSNQNLFASTVGLMSEATEAIKNQIDNPMNKSSAITEAFRQKAKKIADDLDAELKIANPANADMSQSEVDKLLKKLNR